jgi:hypothetical protein
MPMGTDSHDDAKQQPQPEVPAGYGVYEHGDVIDLGGSELKDKHGRTIMTLKFEAEVVGGTVGEHRRHAQVAAIRDVLTYLANQNADGQGQAPGPE